MEENHHGFVLVYCGRNERIHEIRKTTGEQRLAIIFAFIKDYSGDMVKVTFLSDKLGVSGRTIQSDIWKLESKGLIKRTPLLDDHGKQRANRYEYLIGKDGSLRICTLDNLYTPKILPVSVPGLEKTIG